MIMIIRSIVAPQSAHYTKLLRLVDFRTCDPQERGSSLPRLGIGSVVLSNNRREVQLLISVSPAYGVKCVLDPGQCPWITHLSVDIN